MAHRLSPHVKKVTAVLNAHREGAMAHASIGSLKRNIGLARDAGYDVEAFAVLDRPDEATRLVFRDHEAVFDRIIEVAHGDLGLSRNHAVSAASGDVVAFLDADDLWCADWLWRAADHANAIGLDYALHSAVNVYFGKRYEVFVHPKPTDPGFTYAALAYQNLWTALVAAPRTMLLAVPYRPARPSGVFGYEDWAWNCEILERGYRHACVEQTTHFIRVKRLVSLSANLINADAWRIPLDMSHVFADRTDVEG